MSTHPPVAPPHDAPGQPMTGANEIRIVSHSNLFYWWPVWAVGFIMAGITWFSGSVMTVVPRGTEAAEVKQQAQAEQLDKRDHKIELEGRKILVTPAPRKGGEAPPLATPHLRMARSKNLGVIFAIIILLVIAITNIPLRGLWSVIVIVVVIMGAIIFALMDWWEPILEHLSLLDIRINFAGYFFISVVLFIIWAVTLFLFDQQIYMVFTPGQLRVRLEIGEGETAYDTRGMTIQKQRSDLFRHWILGLGSGDLIVNTAGAQVHHFDLPNVLFVGRKVKEIENMLRSVPVVREQAV